MRMKSSLTWMSCFVALLCIGCNDSAQLIDISTKTLPFTKSVNMKKGDAFRLRMPDGLELAFWCESQDFPVAEQTTSSGLDLGWGEKPFRFSPVVYERDSDEKKASTHILFEGVATNSQTSESSFTIGDCRVVLSEDIKSSNGLPVKITVEPVKKSVN